METSQANRLPAIDSLPDGFVEGSADLTVASAASSSSSSSPPSPPDYKDALLDLEQPEPALPSDDGVASEGTSNGGVTAAMTSEEKFATGSALRGDSNPVEAEGCLELHTSKVGDKSTEPECSQNRKLDIETKRKVKKCKMRPEKELLELALKYQNAITERDAAIAVREKLESLCRELQRQNKLLMEECDRVYTEGQNIRSDISTKFKDAIKDASNKLEEQKDECISQIKENDLLRNKLKQIADQYALSEQHFEQKLKEKTLELQLSDLKIQQHQERAAKEQTQMQLYAEQVTQLLETEKSLRLQLAADGEKFQQFQDALLKSNEVFETFKQEMEKMAKLIKDLKKENVFLKSKCEKSDFSIIKLVEDREHMKKQLEKMKNQKDKLESLCRSLQAERKQNSAKMSTTDPIAETVVSPVE